MGFKHHQITLIALIILLVISATMLGWAAGPCHHPGYTWAFCWVLPSLLKRF